MRRFVRLEVRLSTANPRWCLQIVKTLQKTAEGIVRNLFRSCLRLALAAPYMFPFLGLYFGSRSCENAYHDFGRLAPCRQSAIPSERPYTSPPAPTCATTAEYVVEAT